MTPYFLARRTQSGLWIVWFKGRRAVAASFATAFALAGGTV